MKFLKIVTCLFYVGLFGFVLYTHYDTKKFIRSLPQPPTMQRDVSPGEKTPTDFRGTPDTDLIQTDFAADTPSDTFSQTDTETGHRHPDDLFVESTSFLEPDVTQHAEETVSLDTTSEVQPPPGWVPWITVGPDGSIVYDREAIISEFGDTPKVHAYLRLERKIHTADSYTAREIYEFQVLEKEFTQDPAIRPEHLEKLRNIAAQNPDAVIRSWQSLKNDPNITIIIVNGTE